MSTPQDAPLPNPEGSSPLAATNQGKHPKNRTVKRFFKNFSIGRLFARRKASSLAGKPMEQGPLAVNEPAQLHELHEMHAKPEMPKMPEMHEMQELKKDFATPTEVEEPQPSPIPESEPEPQTVS